MTNEHQQVVQLQRSVRYGRLLIGGAVVGGLIATLATVLIPIPEGSMYELRQIAGFMLLIGAAVGLALGAALALILTRAAKRGRGTGVVAIATESGLPESTDAVEKVESPAQVDPAATNEAGETN